MHQALERYRRGLVLLGRVETVLVVVLLANIVVCITGQVVSRYFFDRPIVWVEEVATYSFIWAVFLGAAVALKHDQHLRIEIYVGRLGPRGQAAARSLVALIILGLFALILRPLWVGMGIEMRRDTIALPLPLPMGLFFSLPLLVAVVSMTLTTLYRLLAELAFLAGVAPAAPPIMPPRPALDEDEEVKAERALTGDE